MCGLRHQRDATDQGGGVGEGAVGARNLIYGVIGT